MIDETTCEINVRKVDLINTTLFSQLILHVPFGFFLFQVSTSRTVEMFREFASALQRCCLGECLHAKFRFGMDKSWAKMLESKTLYQDLRNVIV